MNTDLPQRIRTSTTKDTKVHRGNPEQRVLESDMDGHKIQMQLKLQDRSKFMLVNCGFH